MTTDTRTRFLSVVTKHFGAIETPAQDPLDAKLIDDLKFDSLDTVEVVMMLEDEFAIIITDDEAEPFAGDNGHAGKTLRDLLALVESKVAAA